MVRGHLQSKVRRHEYFGEWQDSDDPYLNDRITGPVDAFITDSEIELGQKFLRVGCGICEKPLPEKKWQHPFRVVDPGNWITKRGANWIEMIQRVNDAASGQGYEYVKRLTLTPGKPQLVIDHWLTNRGKAPIKTEVYNHNFFVMDNQPTGPDFTVRFPFEPQADRKLRNLGVIDGYNLTYSQDIPQGKHIFAKLSGFGKSTSDNRFSIENRKTKAGVHVATDRPMDSLNFWSPRTTLCPEPYINLNIEANQSDRWTIQYTFYTLKD